MIYGYLKHVFLTTNQYESILQIKNNLKSNEVFIVIDFSQNYMGKYHKEVQGTHYGASKKQISLQTGLVYFKNADGIIEHISFVTFSDHLDHNAVSAWAYLLPILENFFEVYPNVDTIHFESDGPSSQYKNKNNFWLFTYFCNHFNLKNAT